MLCKVGRLLGHIHNDSLGTLARRGREIVVDPKFKPHYLWLVLKRLRFDWPQPQAAPAH